MSAAIEISEGIATDGQIFQPPQSNIENEKPRYLAFVGSLIEAQTAVERPWTKGGGIEVTNPCLRYVKNFLRKGRITPLLKDTHDYRPADWIKKIVDGEPTQNGYFQQPIPAGYVPPNLPPARGGGFGNIPSPTGNLVGKVAYPGDQINWIIAGNANMFENMRRGIVEIRSLRGQEYKPQQLNGGVYVDPVIWEIQKTIFPTYPMLPTLLDDIERILDDASEHTSIREIVDDFHESFTQFRDYASTTIQNSHAKMREIASKTQGYIPRYTAMDLILLEQLGMARQDREIQKATRVEPDSDFKEMFRQFLESQKEEKEALAGFLKAQTPIVDQNTMAAAPTVEGFRGVTEDEYQAHLARDRKLRQAKAALINETPESQEQIVAADVPQETLPHVCDCGKGFDTPQGLSMHKRRHCELTKPQAPDVAENETA